MFGKKESKTVLLIVGGAVVVAVAALLVRPLLFGSAIVGTWHLEERPDYSITFYEDGDVDNVKFTQSMPGYNFDFSPEVKSWKQQNDGTLILTCAWSYSGTVSVAKTNDRSKAEEDPKYYYLSGNTLVWQKNVWTR